MNKASCVQRIIVFLAVVLILIGHTSGLTMWALILGVPSILYAIVFTSLYKHETWRDKPFNFKGKVFVVIPFFNEERMITEALKSVDAQNYTGTIEVVMVDDHSTDNSLKYADRFKFKSKNITKHIIPLKENSGGKSKPLNVALEFVERLAKSEDDLVILLDSDTLMMPYSVTATVSYMANNPSVSGAGGLMLINPRHRTLRLGVNSKITDVFQKAKDGFCVFLQWLEHYGALHMSRSGSGRVGELNVMAGAYNVMRLSAIEKVGQFGEDCIVEDYCWTVRVRAAGLKLGYINDFVALTDPQPNFKGLWNQRRRWGHSRFEAFRDLRSRGASPWYIGWVFVNGISEMLLTAGCVLTLVMIFANPAIALVYIGLGWWAINEPTRKVVNELCEEAKITPPTAAQTLLLVVALPIIYSIQSIGSIEEIFGKGRIWGTR